MEVLEREGVVEYLATEMENGGWHQEIERKFSEAFYDANLDLSNKDPEVLDIYNEVALVRRGDSATMLEDYSTLIGFLARLCYCGMFEHSLPICTDTNLLYKILSERPKVGTGKSGRDIKPATYEALLAPEILRAELPDLHVHSCEDILEVRHKLRDELHHFRAEVAALAATIQAEPWSESFKVEVGRLISSKVNPAVSSLERRLSTTTDRFLLSLLRSMKSPLSFVPLLASVYANLPLRFGVFAGISSALFEAALETNLEEKKISSENGFSFLLKMRRDLGKRGQKRITPRSTGRPRASRHDPAG